MAQTALTPSILFVERGQLRFFTLNLASILVLPLPPTTMEDLDVKNSEELKNLVKDFVGKNKLPPGQMVIILSPSVCFEKNFVESSSEQDETLMTQFVETVPFEYTRSRLYKNGRNGRIVVANRDFYEALETAFEKVGFLTISIAPFTPLGISAVNGYDLGVAKQLASRLDLIKQNSFYNYQEPGGEVQKQKKVIEKKQTFLLLGIFLLLFLILIVMVVLNNPFAAPKAPAQAPVNPADTSPPPQVVKPPAVTNLASSSAVASNSASPAAILKVQIVNGSGVNGEADSLKKQLQQLGINNIAVSTATTSAVTKTTLTYLSSVPTNLLEQVLAEVKKFAGNATTVQTDTSQYDISITLGKPE